MYLHTQHYLMFIYYQLVYLFNIFKVLSSILNIFTTNLIFITFQQFNIFLNYHHTSNINVIKYKYLYIILLCVFVLWLLKILWVYILWWCYSTHKQQNIFIIFIIHIISLHHQTEFTLNYSNVIWMSIQYNISWIQQYS